MEEPQPLNIGDVVLERYRVERRIAAGGHSVVYRGSDERLTRPVCIKAFHKSRSSDSASDSGIWQTAYDHFVQEAFALSKLSHPNTLCIYDFGHVECHGGERPLQISEFMGGGTLSEIVRRDGALSVQEAVEVAGKLAQALAEAHRSGIIHRDIKPQNILFTTRGIGREPKLADFGIAKSLGRLTENQAEDTNVVVGFPLAMYSPSWAAPEQLCGATASASADIYSLALVTIFSLTGRAIVATKEVQRGYEIRASIGGLIESALAEVGAPRGLVEVLRQACAFEATERPQSASEFAASIANCGARASGTSTIPSDEGREAGTNVTAPLGLALKPTPARVELGVQGTLVTTEMVSPSLSASLRRSTRRDAESYSDVGDSLGNRAVVVLSRTELPQTVGARSCQFLAFENDTLLLCLGDQKLQFTNLPNSSGRGVHLKGVTSFLSTGGRPTSAMLVDKDTEIDLLNPRKKVVGRVYVRFGVVTKGRVVFRLGTNSVSIDSGECPDVLLVDNPATEQSFFLHRRSDESYLSHSPPLRR